MNTINHGKCNGLTKHAAANQFIGSELVAATLLQVISDQTTGTKPSWPSWGPSRKGRYSVDSRIGSENWWTERLVQQLTKNPSSCEWTWKPWVWFWWGLSVHVQWCFLWESPKAPRICSYPEIASISRLPLSANRNVFIITIRGISDVSNPYVSSIWNLLIESRFCVKPLKKCISRLSKPKGGHIFIYIYIWTWSFPKIENEAKGKTKMHSFSKRMSSNFRQTKPTDFRQECQIHVWKVLSNTLIL